MKAKLGRVMYYPYLGVWLPSELSLGWRLRPLLDAMPSEQARSEASKEWQVSKTLEHLQHHESKIRKSDLLSIPWCSTSDWTRLFAAEDLSSADRRIFHLVRIHSSSVVQFALQFFMIVTFCISSGTASYRLVEHNLKNFQKYTWRRFDTRLTCLKS